MFEPGTKVKLHTEVVVLGAYKEQEGWYYRVKFDNQKWSFIVSAEEVEKISLCDYAPFPKCNNGEGCDTCQFNKEK